MMVSEVQYLLNDARAQKIGDDESACVPVPSSALP